MEAKYIRFMNKTKSRLNSAVKRFRQAERLLKPPVKMIFRCERPTKKWAMRWRMLHGGLSLLPGGDHHAVVRLHVAWAMSKIGGSNIRRILKKHLSTEPSNEVRQEIEAALLQMA